MKTDKLQDAMNLLPEDLVEEASLEYSRETALKDLPAGAGKRQRPWMKWAGFAACLVLVLAGTAYFTGLGGLFTRETGAERGTDWPTKIIYVHESDQVCETALQKPWDTRSLTEKYISLVRDDREYDCVGGETWPAERLRFLEETVLTAADPQTERVYENGARVYAMEGTDPELALYVELDGDEGGHVYMNPWYWPKDMAELIQNFRLTQPDVFTAAYYTYKLGPAEGTAGGSRIRTIVFEKIDDAKIKELLFADTSLTTGEIPEGHYEYERAVSFSTNVKELGIDNLSVRVTDTGYLFTNVGMTAKVYLIGEEKAAEIIDFVITNYEGVEFKYEMIEIEVEVKEMTEQDLPEGTVIGTTASEDRFKSAP